MRIAACLALMVFTVGAAAQTPPGGVDYDVNDNNLIDVETSTQLQAIAHDLAGAGNAAAAAYGAAFPDAVQGMGCPGTCKGYELLNDIDLSGVNWTPIGGGRVLGPFANPPGNRYNAVFEGNGHVIERLHLSSTVRNLNSVGLFGVLGSDGVVRNVGLVNVNVDVAESISFWVGALVGANFGQVAASYVVGGMVRGHYGVGGLTGRNERNENREEIVASYADVTVAVRRDRAGGLVGWNRGGRIIASYARSRLKRLPYSPAATGVGGVVGLNEGSGDRHRFDVIQSSYYAGDVGGWGGGGVGVPGSPARSVGKLREPTTATGIYDGWDKLNVDGVASTAMGVVTLNDDSPWDFGSPFQYPVLRGVSARYPHGNTTATGVQWRLQSPVLVALSQRGDAVVAEGSTVRYAVEWDAGVSAVVTMSWSVELTGSGAGHAEASDFADSTRGTVVLVNTDSAVFRIRIAQDGTPDRRETYRVRLSDLRGPDNVYLGVASSAVVSVIAPDGRNYDADGNNLIDVTTTSQLAAIRHDLGGEGLRGVDDGDGAAYEEAFPFFDEVATCAGGCKGYELLNDLDLSGIENWAPIGGGDPIEHYSAVFEGNGHVISKLRIHRPSSRLHHAGLFGGTSSVGTIRNVGLRDVNVHVGDSSIYTGALVGRNDGKVAASYVVGGSVEGVWAAGGLAGANYGTVIASYADVEVHADEHRSGGLIGEAGIGSVVSASYSIGMVTGGTYGGSTLRGGLLGGRNEPDADKYDVQASYFDRVRSGQSSCCGQNVPSYDADTSRTSAQLRAPTTAVGIYTGWDKLNVDGVASTAMGVVTLNDDSPWDFGSDLEYPALRGVSARYPGGNTTAAGVQRRLLPPVSVTLSQRSDAVVAEGSTVRYVVELDAVGSVVVTMSWSVELTGSGAGHAEASDFADSTRGTVALVNTDRAVFRIRIAQDGTPDRRETYRVRLSDLRGPDNVHLGVASSAVVSVIAPNGRNYDADGNNLIDVTTTSQLAAIRHDLGGEGLRGVDDEDKAAYDEAFPFFDEVATCAGDCKGYELLNDLDLSGIENWTPIGGSDPIVYYTAVFEGNGHVISKLRIHRPSSRLHHAGLFGGTSDVGTIRNVGLRDVSVRVWGSSIYTGALVGRNHGKVAASWVIGGSVGGVWSAGGLVGINSGTVIASYADVEVHAIVHRSGGLIGEAGIGSVVSASYSIGMVTGGEYGGSILRGGLLGGGRNEPDAVRYDVQASYFDRVRSGQASCCGQDMPSYDADTSRTSAQLRIPTTAVGIYTGWDKLNVDDAASTAMGVVTLNDDGPWDFGSDLEYPVLRGVSARYPDGNTTAAGVQRRLLSPISVTLSQRSDAVAAEGSTVRYAVELDAGGSVVVTMSWSVELTGSGAGHAEASDFASSTRGTVALVNTNSAVFSIRIAQDGTPERRETYRVRLSDLRGPDNVHLGVASSAVVSVIASNGRNYDADGNNLINVATTSQLAAIRHDLGGEGLRGVDDEGEAAYEEAFSFFDEAETCAGDCRGYELSNDLDLSGVEWQPLGGGVANRGNGAGDEYTGTFEGNGFVISGMRIVLGSRLDNVGLFGILGAGGMIRNTGLRDVEVDLTDRSVVAGALAGINKGRIAASYVVGGSVKTGYGAGGLVGTNEGAVIACYANVEAHAKYNSDEALSGGLVSALADSGVVSASYSIGKPSARGGVTGGLAGWRADGGEIQSSYFDTERSGLSSCCGSGASLPYRSSRTSAELRGPTTAMGIYAGWDKLNVDGVDQGGDRDLNDDAPWDFGSPFQYPVLRQGRTTATAEVHPGGVDYDVNDNNLIDVETSTQLQAIAHDLAGAGNAAAAAYGAAFPDAVQGMGCPGTCKGYELLNDIDLSGVNWTPIGGGRVLGPFANPPGNRYNAVFEGNGHVIERLHLSSTVRNLNSVGLFGVLGSDGVVRNVGLVNVNVDVAESISFWVGALVGANFGQVAASYVVGGMVRGFYGVGGLTGRNERNENREEIVASYADVTVAVRRDRAGGLVGWNRGGRIIASYARSRLKRLPYSPAATRVGGVVGFNEGSGDRHRHDVIQSSYYAGDVGGWGGGGVGVPGSPARSVGKLREPTTATGIYDGWDKLNVDGVASTAMGVVTLNDDSPWDFGSPFQYPVLRGVSARYPHGNTTATGVQWRLQSPVLVALSQRGDAVVAEGSTVRYAVEWDAGVSAVVTMSWSVELTGSGVGHAEASDFADSTRGTVALVNTDSAVFSIRIARDGTPDRRETYRVRLSDLRGPDNVRLDVASSAVVSVIAPDGRNYDADGNNLIDVSTTSQLAAIRHDLGGEGLRGVDDEDRAAYEEAFPFFDEVATCAGGCKGYELLNDVDLSGIENWTPIGGGDPIAYYTAVFEGNGHVISKLRIHRPSSRLHHAGLFGGTSDVGTIRNVGLRDVNVRVGGGSFYTGALVGRNHGKVAASYVVGGSVEGVWSAGGLAGANYGTVIASYADVEVHADEHGSGGLIGEAGIGSVVSASYSIGMVTGGTYDGSTLRGGLLGGRNETDADKYDVQASYFDRVRSGQTSCCGQNVPSYDADTSRTSAQLRAPTTAVGIYSGWDKLNVDDAASTAMGVVTLNDDSPWDFGSDLEYPALRGVSARYPGGNTTAAGVQRRLLPPVSVTLSQRSDAVVAEGSTVRYVVELDAVGSVVVTMSWSVELTGSGAGHAEASDFADSTRGTVALVNTDSAVFSIRIAQDGTPDRRETYRVRLSDLRGPDNVHLGVASSAVVSVIAPDGRNYDADGNNLIDVSTTSQLAAIRHDLGGEGLRGVDDEDRAAYEEAFPFFDEVATCAGDCKGYELLNDLDLSGIENWTPIGGGDPIAYYTAVFEGNGHVISKLRIHRPSSRLHHAGLFGGTSDVGTIRNVGLRDVSVRVWGGSYYTGALVGRNHGKVAASWVIGGSVGGVFSAGGLVGINSGTVIASYADVEVHAIVHRSGGLIGEAGIGSVVSASYSIGMVTGGEYGGSILRGGLLGGGRNEPDAVRYDVQASYFDRVRSGQASCCGQDMPSFDADTSRTSAQLRIPTTAVGIYTGWDELNVDDAASTAMGVVTLNDDGPWDFGSDLEYPVLRGVSARYPDGNTTAAGVQRRLLSPISVTLSQRSDAVAAEGSTVRYAVELDAGGSVVVTMSWSVELTGSGAGHAEASDFASSTRGTVTLVNTNSAVFSIRIAQDGTLERRETYRVRLSDLRGPDNVHLGVASSAVVSVIASNGRNYDADGNNLINVATTSQLAAIRHDLGGEGLRGVDDEGEAAYEEAFSFFDEAETCAGDCRGYELSNDLDLSGVEWQPLGGGVANRGNGAGDEYTGTFEGNGFVISGMRIVLGSRLDNVGLFGILGAGGMIRNTGLRDVEVDLTDRSVVAGALAGINKGRIAASYVVGGSVKTGYGAGGLVGTNEGAVIACYANVEAHAKYNSDEALSGGLVSALADSGVVSASYSIGKPSARGGVTGGLAGWRADGGEIQSSYFDTERSGLSSCCGSGASLPYRSSRTSAELRGPTTAMGIYAGWDKLNVDGVDQGGDRDLNDDAPWDFGSPFQYPVLRQGRTTATVQAQYSSQTRISLTPVLDGSRAVSEGERASYVVSLERALPLGVTASWSWAVDGGVVGADDFDDTTRGNVVIAPGRSSASFSLAVAVDGFSEPEEVFEVSLGDAVLSGNADNASLGRGSVVQTTIAANGDLRVTVAAASATVDEGATATFMVRLVGVGAGDGAVTVEYEITAVSEGLTPADLQSVTAMDRGGVTSVRVVALPVTGSVTVGVGDIARVSVRVAGDDTPGESGEQFRLRLTGCRNCGLFAEIGVPAASQVGIRDRISVVSAHVYLQGAYAGGDRMRTRLIEYLPASSPYGTAPWNAPQITVPGMSAGDFGLSGVTDTVVDWVLVELRKTPRHAGAAAAVTPLARQAALLLGDGTIVGVDGLNGDALRTEGVLFGAGIDSASEDLYVLIHHRNHLSVMATATAVACDAGAGADYCVDFRLQPSHQNCQAPLAGGRYAMFAGDTDGDNDVDADDEAAIRASNLETIGRRHYRAVSGNGYAIDADLDFDGEVLSADRRYIILNKIGNTLPLACAVR